MIGKSGREIVCWVIRNGVYYLDDKDQWTNVKDNAYRYLSYGGALTDKAMFGGKTVAIVKGKSKLSPSERMVRDMSQTIDRLKDEVELLHSTLEEERTAHCEDKATVTAERDRLRASLARCTPFPPTWDEAARELTHLKAALKNYEDSDNIVTNDVLDEVRTELQVPENESIVFWAARLRGERNNLLRNNERVAEKLKELSTVAHAVCVAADSARWINTEKI